MTKNGSPRDLLTSFEEYERLTRREQQAFFAGETPNEFLVDIERLARGRQLVRRQRGTE